MYDSNKVGLVLVAPALANDSCWSSSNNTWNRSFPLPVDILKALFIFAVAVGIVFGNIILICVLNSRKYTHYIDNQPRYLLTSLALNDLFTGILIAPVALLPALYRCWPYGETFCQIQALLRGALSQQSAVILVCMAIDRYLYLLHPEKYYRHSSKKVCVVVISLTWILSVSLFAVMVLPKTGYYFNSTGLLACDVFHSRVAFRILSCCAYYFPTTMALMYCYGSAFHVNKQRSKSVDHHIQTNVRQNGVVNNGNDTETFGTRRHNVSTSRTMAAMSLSFILVVTPATILEVVAACTGSKVPATIDFVVTWLALSDSFWNPFLYWLLNQHFRRICKEWSLHYVCCCRNRELMIMHRTSGCCASTSPLDILPPPLKPDMDRLGEKYWGEILERTLSSSSLQALQKSCNFNNLEILRWNSFNNCPSSHCQYKNNFLESNTPTQLRNFHRGSTFQIDVCDSCPAKSSAINLHRPSFDCERSRSNLSLDETNFSKFNGRSLAL